MCLYISIIIINNHHHHHHHYIIMDKVLKYDAFYVLLKDSSYGILPYRCCILYLIGQACREAQELQGHALYHVHG